MADCHDRSRSEDVRRAAMALVTRADPFGAVFVAATYPCPAHGVHVSVASLAAENGSQSDVESLVIRCRQVLAELPERKVDPGQKSNRLLTGNRVWLDEDAVKNAINNGLGDRLDEIKESLLARIAAL